MVIFVNRAQHLLHRLGNKMTIRAIGTYLPDEVIDNLPICESFGKDQKFLQEKLGFLSRRQKGASESVSDMCVRAVEDLESYMAFDRRRIGLLVVVTQNPELKIPHTAAILHQKLGLAAGCMTFDVSQGCAGYLHGLAIVDAVMRSQGIQEALLLTCDPYSVIVDPTDLVTAMIFGDAATATFLTLGGSGFQLADATFGTAQGSWKCLTCHDHFHMDGRQVLSNAIHEVPTAIRTLLDRRGLHISDIDLYAFHQASRHALEKLQEALDIDPAKAPFVAAHTGNTVSSSIPLMLKARVNAQSAGLILACGFGVGFSWGAGLLTLESRGN